MLDESIIDNAPSDPVDAFFHYLEYFYKFIENNCEITYKTNYAQITIANSDSEKTLGIAIEFYGLLNAQVEECGVEYNFDGPNPSGDPQASPHFQIAENVLRNICFWLMISAKRSTKGWRRCSDMLGMAP